MSEKKCCSPNREVSDNFDIKMDFDIKKSSEESKLDKMIKVSQGKFLMGTDYENAFVADGEGPVREVEIDTFYFDKFPVTNKDFDNFCSKTGYKTEAEKFGWSFVFFQLVSNQTKKNVNESVSGAPWWWKVDDAFWRKPYGGDSNLKDLENHPVVHVSWNDANAYAASFHQNDRKETRINPSGPKYGSSKTMKGGSYLCNDSYCNRYRASARTQNTPDSSTGNLGFRLIYRNK